MCIFTLRRALLGLLLAVMTSCTTEQQPNEPQIREIQSTELRFPGGHLLLPRTGPWLVLDSPGTQAATRMLSPTHTIVAGIQHRRPTSNLEAAVWLYQGKELVYSWLEEIRASFTKGRYKSVSFGSSPIALQQAKCENYTVEAMDHKFPGDEGRAYPYRATGRICFFTDLGIQLHIQFSERRAAKEQPLSTFDADAADFLASLSPSTPVPDPGTRFFDGVWQGVMICGSCPTCVGPIEKEVDVTIRDGGFDFVPDLSYTGRGTVDKRGHMTIRWSYDMVYGSLAKVTPRNFWFDGSYQDGRFELKGEREERKCTVTLSRAAPK